MKTVHAVDRTPSTVLEAERFDAVAFANSVSNQNVIVLSVARSLLRVGFLACAAIVVGRLVFKQDVPMWHIGLGAVLLGLAALVGLWGDRVQARTEARVATELREYAGRRLASLATRQLQAIPVGRLVMALQRDPDAIAALVVGHHAAKVMMGVGPLLAAAALMIVSWQAALTVLGLTPVMIVFFALVGDTIRRRAAEQEKAFGHLAGQFADRVRTLPTILANHAFETEDGKLAVRLNEYAERTMRVLRIAFLNAAIIDFFASLSIAMLAVFLGLGHLGLFSLPGFSGLALWQSLFILMIAPEYFAPFRRFAEQYHAKAEGEAAAASLDALLSPTDMPAPSAAVLDALPEVGALPLRGLVVVTGPSGAGKTTLLRRLAGIDGSASDDRVLWVSTDSFVPAGTLADAIAWNGPDVGRARLLEVAGMVGLLDDDYLPGGLDARIVAGGANLSGGQRLRVANARALLSGRTVVADEPTAKLDSRNAERVRKALSEMAKDRLVIVATHDMALAGLADRRIDLGAQVKMVDA